MDLMTIRDHYCYLYFVFENIQKDIEIVAVVVNRPRSVSMRRGLYDGSLKKQPFCMHMRQPRSTIITILFYIILLLKVTNKI